jgi:hypothetical protein
VVDLDDNLALEKYGANSVCIDQEGSWTKTSGNVATTAVNWGSGCYEVNTYLPRMDIDTYSIHLTGTLYTGILCDRLLCVCTPYPQLGV